jgi:hypothetical protein
MRVLGPDFLRPVSKAFTFTLDSLLRRAVDSLNDGKGVVPVQN